MAKLIIPIGLPGSGKSTWAESTGQWIVSTDAIRIEKFGSLKAGHTEDKAVKNKEVFAEFHDLIYRYLQNGTSTIADATNLTYESRQTLYDIAHETQAEIEVVLFANYTEAFQRNLFRDEDKMVPPDVMVTFLDRLIQTEKGLPSENWNTLIKIDSFLQQ